MQTRTIVTSRLRTHCWVAGPDDGEPLLLVHGNLTTGRFFRALAEALPLRFRIVAPDLRSFGGTEALGVDASRGLRDWSDDLRALLESLGWADQRTVHAAGWSIRATSSGSPTASDSMPRPCMARPNRMQRSPAYRSTQVPITHSAACFAVSA